MKKTDTHKGGVDCLGLLIGVAKELDILSKTREPFSAFDEMNYSLSPDGEYLKTMLTRLLYSVSVDEMQSGDIALFRMDNNPQHLAVINKSEDGSFTMVHAYAPSRMVVENSLDDFWKEAMVAVFRVPLEIPSHA